MSNTSLLYYNIIKIRVRVILLFQITYIYLYSKVPWVTLLMPHLSNGIINAAEFRFFYHGGIIWNKINVVCNHSKSIWNKIKIRKLQMVGHQPNN